MARHHARLVLSPGTPEEREFPFVDRIEIGRSLADRREWTSVVELSDPEVSSRHCVVTQTGDGVFLIRDRSRNGTRVDGKRLIPNIEIELQPNETISVGRFLLSLQVGDLAEEEAPVANAATVVARNVAMVTLLVGDIRGYTTLNQQEDPAEVTRAVLAVFSQLEEIIVEHGGSLKEVQGDALFAFWELTLDSPGDRVVQAMDAALALQARVSELAGDREIWLFADFPLEMDFAITTGTVAISSFGKDRPIGLSMVGDTVNLAFRLEKLATDETGPILVCSTSRQLAADHFEFEDLGEERIRGRKGMERVFALRRRST